MNRLKKLAQLRKENAEPHPNEELSKPEADDKTKVLDLHEYLEISRAALQARPKKDEKSNLFLHKATSRSTTKKLFPTGSHVPVASSVSFSSGYDSSSSGKSTATLDELRQIARTLPMNNLNSSNLSVSDLETKTAQSQLENTWQQNLSEQRETDNFLKNPNIQDSQDIGQKSVSEKYIEPFMSVGKDFDEKLPESHEENESEKMSLNEKPTIDEYNDDNCSDQSSQENKNQDPSSNRTDGEFEEKRESFDDINEVRDEPKHTIENYFTKHDVVTGELEEKPQKLITKQKGNSTSSNNMTNKTTEYLTKESQVSPTELSCDREVTNTEFKASDSNSSKKLPYENESPWSSRENYDLASNFKPSYETQNVSKYASGANLNELGKSNSEPLKHLKKRSCEKHNSASSNLCFSSKSTSLERCHVVSSEISSTPDTPSHAKPPRATNHPEKSSSPVSRYARPQRNYSGRKISIDQNSNDADGVQKHYTPFSYAEDDAVPTSRQDRGSYTKQNSNQLDDSEERIIPIEIERSPPRVSEYYSYEPEDAIAAQHGPETLINKDSTRKPFIRARMSPASDIEANSRLARLSRMSGSTDSLDKNRFIRDFSPIISRGTSVERRRARIASIIGGSQDSINSEKSSCDPIARVVSTGSHSGSRPSSRNNSDDARHRRIAAILANSSDGK